MITRFAPALLAAAVSAAPLCHAASSEEDLAASFGEEEFLSIATGQKQLIAKAPAVASVITADDIKALGATTLEEILETVPGIHVSLSSTYLSPIVSVRGVYTDYAGREFKCPALSRLCPVTALGEWTAAAGLSAGPVFRKIDRWGHVAQEALGANSLIPILRCVFAAAGLASAQEYSSHSLRRGFAAWARASGWDIKELMEYVGWKDIKSAMRYLEASDASLQARFEHGLAMPGAAPSPITAANPPAPAVAISEAPVIPMAVLRVKMTMDRFNKLSRGWSRAHRLIEKTCFERYAMQRLDAQGTEYELRVPCPSRDGLEEAIYALLDDMYRVADANQCRLEASIHEPISGAYWS